MKLRFITIALSLLLLFPTIGMAGPSIGGVGAGTAGTGDIATDTIWDTAGDTVYGTGSNTAAKLGIGTAYQLYMTNAGATAPAWTSTLGATGTRLTKGWFTDLEITNAPTINGAAWTTILQPLDTELTGLASVTSAASTIPYFTGSGTATVLAAPAAQGYMIVSGATPFAPTWLAHPGAANYALTTDSATGVAWAATHSHSDSAAQFYSATASKGTFKMLMTSMSDGILGTFTPVCTGACVFTTPSLGAGTYTVPFLSTAQTFTASQTFTTSILPVAATTTIGSSDAEWGGLYLGDGKIIYGQADQSATLTSGASLWTANNFAVTTQFKLPSTDADPTATAGYLRHDSSSTEASTTNLGILKWHDGTNVRTVVDTGAAYTLITKYEYMPIRYAEDDDTVAAPAAAAEIGTTSLIARSFAEDADNGVVFFWQMPGDYVSGIKYRVYFATDTNAGAGETAAFNLSGCAFASSGAIACSEGTGQASTLELTADEDTGELLVSGWSPAITIGGSPAAGQIAKLLLIRDVSEDDMVGHALISGIEIKYVGKINPFSDY